MSREDDRPDPAARLRELIAPLLARVAALDPASRTEPAAVAELEATLAAEFPPEGEALRAVGDEIARGVAEGWLCDRGDPGARFCRLARPGPETHDLSVDVVSLLGPAVEHTHPRGEVTIGFRAPDAHVAHDPESGADPEFDGRPAGWVFLPPGSRHVPRVSGHRMYLMYFLPGGAVQWHPAP